MCFLAGSSPSFLQDFPDFLALLMGILWALLCPFLAKPTPLVPLASSASPWCCVTYWENTALARAELLPHGNHRSSELPDCQKKKANRIKSQRKKCLGYISRLQRILMRHARKPKKSWRARWGAPASKCLPLVNGDSAARRRNSGIQNTFEGSPLRPLSGKKTLKV